MINKTIYVLHEYGAPTHYHALVELAKQNNYEVRFREFIQKGQLKKWVKSGFKDLSFFRNIIFAITIPFRPKCKIVLGIAPYNKKLPFIMSLLNKHDVYYHTSYSCWDGSRFAHEWKSPKSIQIWKEFTNHYVKHIFSVSKKTKDELINNGYSTPERISVVNHSYKTYINVDEGQRKNNNFIFVGRIVKQKGIEELLHIFATRPECNLYLVGKGDLEHLVNEYTQKHPNIIYMGYINGLNNIIPIYKQCSFVVLNSHRNSQWEELFGITLIEGISCGCVPLATNHPGPKEIISDTIDGYLCEEGSIESLIDKAISLSDADYHRLRSNCIQKGQSYHCSKICSKWNKILEK